MEGKYFFIGLLFLGLFVVGFYSLYHFYGEGSIMEELLNKEIEVIISQASLEKSPTSKVLSPYKIFNGWKVFITGNESILFDVTLVKNEVCMIPKFNGTITLDESYIDEDSNKTIEKYVNYTQPTTLKLTTKNISPTLTKTDNKFCYELNKSESLYYKFGESSVILVGDTSYDSIDNNITQETGFAHLNISNTAPYDSLRAYYPFDSNVSTTTIYDYSNDNRDGTITGAIFNSSGFIGGAFEFDGDTDYITIGTGSDFSDLCINGCSFTAWVKPSVIDVSQSIIARIDFTGADQFFRIQQATSERITFSIYENGGNTPRCDITSPSSTPLTANNWSFITATFNPEDDESIVCIDNVCFVGTCTVEINETAWQDSESTFIGIRDDGSFSSDFNGLIDEVMIFNDSLNLSQISDIYNNQSARFLPQGTQLFNNTNVSGDGTENRLNITLIDYQNLLGSNISVEVNGIYFNLSSDGIINNLEFTTDPNFLNITFRYISGTNNFYSPLLIGNITLDSWVVSVGETVPIVKLRTPLNNSALTSNPVTFIYNVTATTGIDNCTLTLDDILNETDTSITINTNQSFSKSVTNGDHNWSVSCSNSAGTNSSNVFNFSQIVPVDSCSPSSPLTGNYQFECSDNCIQSTNLDAGGFNIIFNGSGTFSLTANIFNYLKVSIFGESSANKCVVTCSSGGCFRG